MEEIVNKVANSDLKTLDLAEYYDQRQRVFFDIKDLLFQGQILKEKDFRSFISEHDWSVYKDKNVAIGCTVDAIVPAWAYMLIVSSMEPFANKIVIGSLEMLQSELYKESISKLKLDEFTDAKVIIKGCGDIPVPDSAYAEITRVLRPIASSIMYGEPCSTVPIYKRKK